MVIWYFGFIGTFSDPVLLLDMVNIHEIFSGVTNEQSEHHDCTLRRIAVSVKFLKLNDSYLWKHQEVAINAEGR